MDEKMMRIALVGKPNAGKSSLFNQLTGLHQKVGNFTGVTVDKKVGYTRLPSGAKVEIIDLPGLYSLYPRTPDEQIVTEILCTPGHPDMPNIVILVADAMNLKNCLLLLTQLIDLHIPVILAINMMDLADKSGQKIDVKRLSELLDVPVVTINARKGEGLDALKKQMETVPKPSLKTLFNVDDALKESIAAVCQMLRIDSPYQAFQLLQQHRQNSALSHEQKKVLDDIAQQQAIVYGKYQSVETLQRYAFIQSVLEKAMLRAPAADWKKWSYRIDRILIHKVWGYIILFGILFFVFQSLFTLSAWPMNGIDALFAYGSGFLRTHLPEGPLFDLITEGIIPGIGGILIFVPQIAILFTFITILEETGYMARVIFLMDRIMRHVGLDGRSVVPLISGWACAIPAIMATRTIANSKDRIKAIFILPFMSCSARLPVFAIFIALIIPNEKILGFINYQGIALMGLYMLGVLFTLGTAFVMKIWKRNKERAFLLLEMPTYRVPRWKNVGLVIIEKTRTFVLEAGKIILAISIVLWGLASFGPANEMNQAEASTDQLIAEKNISSAERENYIASYRLEHSYAGKIGHFIEPAIASLGYDWKIGIALITSFAARETFVATIATIYTMGNANDTDTIQQRLAKEINPVTHKPVFSTATGLSLLAFYLLAMQCMSTLAVVRRETKSWKWPLLQLSYMSTLAYLCSFIVFNLFRE